MFTNNELLNQDTDTFEATATKRFTTRWQMLAGYTWTRSRQDFDNIDFGNRVVTDPNERINAAGPITLERPHTFKLTGSYLLPYEIDLSGNVLVQSGRPVTRRATFTGLPQGNVTINVEERGSVRLDTRTTIDLRLARSFRFGTRSLEAMLDIYNLTNANTVWDVRDLTGRVNVREGGVPEGALINQPQFLSPIGILPPRILRFGVAYRF